MKRRRLPRIHLGRPGFVHVPARFTPGGYVAAWRFGYATAAAVGATLLAGLLLAAVAASPVIDAVRDRSIDPLQSAFRPGGSAYPLAILFVVVGTVALVMFSAFVGMTTRNAPLLGSEAAPLAPMRAARVWVNVFWAHARLAVLLVTPPILFGMGLGIPACIGLLVLLEWMQRHLPSLTDWLTDPGRHLVELYDKLGLKGVGSLLIRAWRAAFVAANLLLVLLWCVPLAIAITHQISLFRKEVVPPPAGLIPPQIAVLVLVAAFVVALALTIGLLVPITAELAERQRVRRTLVIAGLARPWTNTPAATGTPREPDWDERPVTRWSDLSAGEREAWQRSLDTAGSLHGAPRE